MKPKWRKHSTKASWLFLIHFLPGAKINLSLWLYFNPNENIMIPNRYYAKFFSLIIICTLITFLLITSLYTDHFSYLNYILHILVILLFYIYVYIIGRKYILSIIKKCILLAKIRKNILFFKAIYFMYVLHILIKLKCFESQTEHC